MIDDLTKATVDRLGLPTIGIERACLIGYGSKKPQNCAFDVVSISLGLPHYNNPDIQFDAYVVSNLNPVHMAGIAKFAQKIKKKGTNLADWRLLNTKSDIINFEILIGADHYYKFVNPYRLPIERLGMWLTFDRFGRNFLFGRIPGSNPVKRQQQINFVSIHNVVHSAPKLHDHFRTVLPILSNSEFVHDINAFN